MSQADHALVFSNAGDEVKYMAFGTYSKETYKEAQNTIVRGVSVELAVRAMLAAIQSGEWWDCGVCEDKDPEEEATK